MKRTVNIKGIGFVSVKADYVEISIDLSTLDKDYSKAYKLAGEKILKLNKAIEEIGFETSDLKTVSFNIESEYSSYKDEKGNYRRKFDGYNVSHRLKLAFDFEVEKLSETIEKIASIKINADVKIKFTVKDPGVIQEELLKSAAHNARTKAEVLCSASGVKLGELLSIQYNWREISVYSDTEYYAADAPEFMTKAGNPIKFEPEDINLRDTADFIWEIG